MVLKNDLDACCLLNIDLFTKKKIVIDMVRVERCGWIIYFYLELCKKLNVLKFNYPYNDFVVPLVKTNDN
jgi:hypothetical protein